MLKFLFKLASRQDRRDIVYRDPLAPDMSLQLIELDRDGFTLFDRGDVSAAERNAIARIEWSNVSEAMVFTGDQGELRVKLGSVEVAETMPGFMNLCDVISQRLGGHDREWYCDGRIRREALPTTRLWRT